MTFRERIWQLRLLNKYSVALLIVTITLVLLGALLLYIQWLKTGLILFTPAFVLLISGWKQLSGSQPRQAALVEILGNRTETIATGTLFTCPGVVEASVFDIVNEEDEEFIVVRNVRCKDKTYIASVKVALAFIQDLTDDSPGTKNWKSAGRKLGEYDDAEKHPGVRRQLVSVVAVLVRGIGTEHDRVWMQNNSGEIGRLVKLHISGLAHGDTETNDDARGLGVKITKCNAEVEVGDEFIKAENDIVLEDFQKQAEVKDAKAFSDQSRELLAGIREENKWRAKQTPPLPLLDYPTRDELWKMVDKIRTTKAGVRKVIDGGGLLHYSGDMETAVQGGKKK